MDLQTQLQFENMVSVEAAPMFPNGVPLQRISAAVILDWTHDDVVFVLAMRPANASACHVSVPYAYDWADFTRWHATDGLSRPLPHGSQAFCDPSSQLRLEDSIALSAALARLHMLRDIEQGAHLLWLTEHWSKLQERLSQPGSRPLSGGDRPQDVTRDAPLLRRVKQVVRELCTDNTRLREVRKILSHADMDVPSCS